MLTSFETDMLIFAGICLGIVLADWILDKLKARRTRALYNRVVNWEKEGRR